MTLARLLTVRADLRDHAAAAEVHPERLDEYVTAHGWQRFAEDDRWWQYQVTPDPNGPVLMVPRSSHRSDYGRRVIEAIRELAEHEGRSPLAVLADLRGWTDPIPAVLADLDEMLGDMVTRPAMYGMASEAVLFQALLTMRVRAWLRGEPDPEVAYDAARKRHRIPSGLHASSRIGLNGIGAFIAEVAGLPSPSREDVSGEATALPDAPEPAPEPAPVAPSRREPPPGLFPDLAEPSPRRRTAVHGWGSLADEEHEHAGRTIRARVQTCRHCCARRRLANTGGRGGARYTYQDPGGAWGDALPACVVKG